MIRSASILYFPLNPWRWRLCYPAPQTMASDGPAGPIRVQDRAAIDTGKLQFRHAGFP